MLEHAELIPRFLAGPQRGPNAIQLGEVTFELLARGGVEGEAAVEAFRVLLIYSLGFAAFEAPRRAEPVPAERRARAETAFAGASPAEELAHMRELAPLLATHPTEETFEARLRWLLDGIAATAAAGRGRRGRR